MPVDALARGAKGGLIITASTLATLHRELIVALASRHRLPAVCSKPFVVAGGGLLSYSPDRIDQFRQLLAYLDLEWPTSPASSGLTITPTCETPGRSV